MFGEKCYWTGKYFWLVKFRNSDGYLNEEIPEKTLNCFPMPSYSVFQFNVSETLQLVKYPGKLMYRSQRPTGIFNHFDTSQLV